MFRVRIGRVQKPQLTFGLLVLLPILAWYALFSFRVNLMGLRMALIDYKLLDPGNSPFVGLRHFETIFTEYKLFWTAVTNTLTYAVLVNISMIPIALTFAYCLANVKRGRTFYQWTLYLPVVVSMAAIALLFRFMMDPDVGVLNRLLTAAGLPRSKWFTSSWSAMYSVVLVGVWKAVGVYIVLFTAGLLNIPQEIYDAALVDGANPWQTWWKITLPLLAHTFKLVLVLVTIGSLQVYMSAFILTNGGPGTATTMISQFILTEAFAYLRFGLASAAAIVLFAFIMLITFAQFRLIRTSWEF